MTPTRTNGVLVGDIMDRSTPPSDIGPETLVAGLADLHRGLQTQLVLLSLGEAAVPALTRFLLGPPDLHPQPRALAAETLGMIGGPRAARALVAAMCRSSLATLTPQLALSEETVRNSAARGLGRIGEPTTAGPLLYALRRYHLIEAGRTLHSLGDTRAIPHLVECLGDSFASGRATAVLFEFGRDAVDALIDGLRHRELRDGEQTPRSIERRTCCARLLGALRDTRAEPALRESLDDPALDVRIAAAVALARVAPDTEPTPMIPALIDGLADLRTVDDCAEALLTKSESTLPSLMGSIYSEAATLAALRARAPSRPLRAMVGVLARAGAGGQCMLARLAADPNPLLGGLALGHLARVNTSVAAPLVEEALRSADVRIRRTAQACARLIGLPKRRNARLADLLARVLHGVGHA
jgi:HEAT repeat protein